MLPTEIKLCCKILGTATLESSPRKCQEKSLGRVSVSILRKRRNTTVIARIQLTPWHRKVAQATPSTPMPRPATNKMSMPILLTEEQAKKRKGVLESPRAEKMPVAML